MKDSTALGIAGMASVSVCYGSYIISHACTGQPIPDGPVLAGVVGAICALGGVLYGERKREGNGGAVATRTLKTF